MKKNRVRTLQRAVLGLALLLAACSPSLSPDGERVDRTGLPNIDRVLDVVESGSAEDLRKLVQFTSLACTHADGFGGPPKCAAGEEEGKLVDVLPVLGPEGHHLRPEELAGWPGLPQAQLYAVYRVGEGGYVDPYFPRGEVALAYTQPGQPGLVILQLTEEGIVRLDYTFVEPAASLEALDPADLLLGPFERRAATPTS